MVSCSFWHESTLQDCYSPMFLTSGSLVLWIPRGSTALGFIPSVVCYSTFLTEFSFIQYKFLVYYNSISTLYINNRRCVIWGLLTSFFFLLYCLLLLAHSSWEAGWVPSLSLTSCSDSILNDYTVVWGRHWSKWSKLSLCWPVFGRMLSFIYSTRSFTFVKNLCISKFLANGLFAH